MRHTGGAANVSSKEQAWSLNKEQQLAKSNVSFFTGGVKATQVSWSCSALCSAVLAVNYYSDDSTPVMYLKQGITELQEILSWHLYVGRVKDAGVIMVCESWNGGCSGVGCFCSLSKVSQKSHWHRWSRSEHSNYLTTSTCDLAVTSQMDACSFYSAGVMSLLV